MSAELSEQTHPTPHVSRWWLLRDVTLVLALFAVGGALCGVLWEWWWTAPSGSVADGTWFPDLEGVRGVFSGTALYVVVGAVGGLVLGAACGWLFDRVELVTLVAVAVGATLAGWLMLWVGTALAPPDPQLAAASAPDGTRLPGTLAVSGDSPFAAFPLGATAGLAAVFIGLAPNRRSRG
ncbi:hypothetical protein [Nocardioides coralli]|uniref:hypothetical protein n=1 Tax=Nocardioides coralli TaxID=2872154 RepID=UPI001CA3BCF3|nr:hypothetical protein [Nocardioides coralli]QZY27944.1 hypothetical protein K6T13_10580 [Nocardioides coralli]